MASKADFDTLYAPRPGIGWSPAIEDTQTIEDEFWNQQLWATFIEYTYV